MIHNFFDANQNQWIFFYFVFLEFLLIKKMFQLQQPRADFCLFQHQKKINNIAIKTEIKE